MTSTNLAERESGGVPVPITGTAQTTGPFYRLLIIADSTTITTTGLTNNLSAQAVPTGVMISFGRELAATITLGGGACIAYKV